MHTFSKVAALFEDFLRREVLFPKEPASLYEPCQYLLDAGGKRIRPALCLMGQEIFSDITEEGFHAAAALELFHNFTLMHDDIMDEAPLRRGKPSVHIKYGQTAGILSGDVMSIYAYRQLERLAPRHFVPIAALFNKMAIEVCEGQQLDFEFEAKEKVSVVNYLEMIALKTASLIATSLRIGAILGGATEEQAGRLYDFGRYMGIAFQLQDDYLDVFGLPEDTGKQPGGDILARKKTILITYYQSVATDNESKLMDEWYGGNDPQKVGHVTRIWKEAGIDKIVQQQVADYTDMAFEQLDIPGIDPNRTQALAQLFRQLMTRKS